MQSSVQVQEINPCDLQTDEERKLLHNFLLAHKDQTYIPAGDCEFNGKKYNLKNSLLRRTRKVFGLPQPQIKFDVLSEAPLAQGGFSLVYSIEKSITLGSRLLRIK